MAERPKVVDVAKLIDKGGAFELKAESPEERDSRLRREEAEADHKLRTQEDEESFKRRINLAVHIFVMTIVAIAFGASILIAIVKDPTTGLPDKAMGIITAIVAGGVGCITGKGSK